MDRRAASAIQWSYRWNPETYAGSGYAVVMIDFHGSRGHGQAFTDAISTHWGDRPFQGFAKRLSVCAEDLLIP